MRLLTLNNEEIVEMLEKMEQESKAIKEEAIKMCWYMRGGINLDQAMQLSKSEREIIAKLIKDNLETTKQTKLPFF